MHATGCPLQPFLKVMTLLNATLVQAVMIVFFSYLNSEKNDVNPTVTNCFSSCTKHWRAIPRYLTFVALSLFVVRTLGFIDKK